MADYGHDLLFGSFLTPAAARPDAVVALARASEAAGLDLVTVQDHPYQPAFLDTWTLLSWVAAVTTSVRVVPNVLNLPLRQPAVLARSAASLDLLSGGRVELGLGTGAFWDAIAAMGGTRLTPGEAVGALEEAIDVVRGLWDTGATGVLHAGGPHHRVDGAKRGPAPAHDIGIWVGAYKPRMLGLVGRLADGWLPSLGYLPGPQALGPMNAAIDAAATDAGRSPAAIRRLLNVSGRFTTAGAGLLVGPAAQWADELADIALAHGISGFVLASDDPRDLERFGTEVAPAVRARVATGRGTLAAQTVAPERDRAVVVPRLDEATRPVVVTGPPVDAAPGGAGALLVEVHDHLRGELRELESLVAQVRAGTLAAGDARSAINAMTVRQNDWTLGMYCIRYCRLVTQHHSIEDASVFPHLRSAVPELGPVLDRLSEEHHVVHDVLEALDRALVAHLGGPEDFAGLDAALDEVSRVLGSHLAYEESQLVGPLDRHGMYPGQF